MASRYKGYMGKILEINLTTGKIGEYEISDDERETFIGGKYLSTKILWDRLMPGTDPLGEGNILVVMTSPFTGSGAPSTSRYDISAKSPLTGAIGHSNSGGNFGIHLKRAGFDGIVIRGRAEDPVYIEIDFGNVSIKDAADLWGLDTEETQDRLGKGGKIVIGPAGENQVLYASIVSEERTHGRCGLGAVMGSKNLKAIVAKGAKRVPVYNETLFNELRKKWFQVLKSHPYTGNMLPRYGSASFLKYINSGNTLPTHDFTRGNFERAGNISGERLAEKYMTRNYGCVSCPVRCGRRVMIGDKEVKGPEFETLALFGSNLDLDDMEKIIEWNHKLDLLGLDSISTGTTIGFAMELSEKGLWNNGLSFGNPDDIGKVIEDIAYRRGIGDELAEGTKRLARKYGGEDFAPHVKGLELPAYEPRGSVGHGLGYATASRGGCHLDAGYIVMYERVIPSPWEPYDTKSKPSLTVLSQSLLGGISAMGSCLFSALTAFPKPMIKLEQDSVVSGIISRILTHSYRMTELILRLPANALPVHLPFSMVPHTRAFEALTGMRMRLGDLLHVGYRGYTLERMFNIREGITKADDTLSRRFTSVLQQPLNPDSRVRLDEMLPRYYRLRGWDEEGVPRQAELKRLGLSRYLA
ncbi:MAG: aldehyde ferredoxin oxidoreductase family protein [Deltaproteobacteria bacterium]|nr:aldehyde ferredoxin oxidoreductase family protein [Deltaproteobacteria bacterium]